VLFCGDAIADNSSLTVDSLKLSAGQGKVAGQLNVRLMFSCGDVIDRDKSLAARSFQLSVDRSSSTVDVEYAACLCS
jgi:hypothetical protein